MNPSDEVKEWVYDILDSVEDDVGEDSFGNYVLKYEGWSPFCFPENIEEEDFLSYASNSTKEILREWDEEMQKRGYTPVPNWAGYEESMGLYGVTFALYYREGASEETLEEEES